MKEILKDTLKYKICSKLKYSFLNGYYIEKEQLNVMHSLYNYCPGIVKKKENELYQVILENRQIRLSF